MIINYNVSSMIANNALARNDAALSKSLERLSSGYKINHAKDNAAGLAMSRRMNAQIKGLSVAGDNVNDGISIVEIADGAMSEVHDILQRMNELTVKASTGTLCDDDREMIDEEFQALKDEIERIGTTTQFNGQNLLDGHFDLKGYSSTDAVSVDYYSDTLVFGKYTIENLVPAYEEDADGNKYLTDATTVGKVLDPDGKEVVITQIDVKDDEITLKSEKGFELKMTIDATKTVDASIELDLTGIGSMTLQIGANQDQTMEMRIPPITKKNLGLSRTNVLTEDEAGEANRDVSKAIKFVSSIRSSLGAYQNRLEHTTANLDVTSENMTSAYSRIMDVDMAEEMTKYSSYQVISQAATSMLAQANERPSQVLQLLQ